MNKKITTIILLLILISQTSFAVLSMEKSCKYEDYIEKTNIEYYKMNYDDELHIQINFEIENAKRVKIINDCFNSIQ